MIESFFRGQPGQFWSRRFAVLIAAALLAVIASGGLSSAALASVTVRIDLTQQRMDVLVNGQHYANWAISSGRKGYRTPTGKFRPKVLRRMHYSKQYDNSPMPHSIFFHHGYAIHGTNYIKRLGRPASHGCVRLHPRNAARLYGLVKRFGMANTRIRITY